MFCGECGTENPDTNQFCKNCGKKLRNAQSAPVPQPAAPLVAAPQPIYIPPPVESPPTPITPQGAAAPSKPRLNKGLLALGIVGILVGAVSWFRYPYLLGLLAIVLGGLAIYKSGNKKGAVTIVASLGIIIGLASIIVDMFYLEIFPPVAPVLLIFWLAP